MLSLIELSFSGGVLIAVIALLRLLAVRRLPPRTFPALWMVALCRLLIPLSLPSPVSVYAAAGRLGISPPGRAGILVDNTPLPAADAPFDLFSAAWLIGACVLALSFFAAHLRSRMDYKASFPVEAPFVQSWLADHRLCRPVQIRYSDCIDSPLTYGVFRPVILLPKGLDWSDEGRLAFILAHEHTHIRRFHALVKLLLAAALCIHWFNPLVYIMYLLANRDLELSCDASVMKEYGPQSRSLYARTLVDLEAKRARFSPLASSFSHNAMEERIIAIMNTRRSTLAGLVVAAVLIAGAALVFATSAPARSSASASNSRANVFFSPGSTIIQGAATVQEKEIAVSGGHTPYTQEQYHLLLDRLNCDGYERMSIAAFNRTVYAALSQDNLTWVYDEVANSLPDDDPSAGFLRNTVAASLNEYTARLDEVYSGEQVDPYFSGTAVYERKADVYGDEICVYQAQLDYSFTYRILNQDRLTVVERDQFLQAVMQGAQDYLDSHASDRSTSDSPSSAEVRDVQEALEAAGKAASNSEIAFTGCSIWYYGYC